MSIRDDLWWLAETVRGEAGGETPLGQLAVAWVIMNRFRPAQHTTIRQIVLAPLQFSFWNGNSTARRNEPVFEQSSCWKAAAAAYFGFGDDPTHGATHYLVSTLEPKPSWFDAERVTIVIGHHTFLRLP